MIACSGKRFLGTSKWMTKNARTEIGSLDWNPPLKSCHVRVKVNSMDNLSPADVVGFVRGVKTTFGVSQKADLLVCDTAVRRQASDSAQ